jgi:hypothetical protein
MKIRRAVILLWSAPVIASGCFDTKVVYSDKDEPGGSSAAGGRLPAPGFDSSRCLECAAEECEDEYAACERSASCVKAAECLFECDSSDAFCASDCLKSDDPEAITNGGLLAACAYSRCADCTTELIGGNGGDGGAPASSGGAPSFGGSSASAGKPAQGGRAGSGGSAPQAGRAGASGGASAGSGGVGGAGAGVQWLSFDGSWAGETMPPNDALRVNGTFYAYGDDCATLRWDPETRCVSGILCQSYPPDYENWGIAIGFDFRNTGMEGDPPNTKLLWNPEDVGARGIAWEIRGTAPAFQIWVLNMDPSWQGQCSEDMCEIAGPPDGVSSPALRGQLSFDQLQKDDWGSAGERYVFDRSAVHALQFKLPAVVAGAASFDFCIERLGIVL